MKHYSIIHIFFIVTLFFISTRNTKGAFNPNIILSKKQFQIRLPDNSNVIIGKQIIKRLKSLISFMDKEVIKIIPNKLFKKISNKIFIISLYENIEGPDAIFIDNQTLEKIGMTTDENELHIWLDPVHLRSKTINSLLAHELLHAIHYAINPNEQSWVREGLAQLFEYIVTGNLNTKNLIAAMNETNTPFFTEYDITNIDHAQYGHNMLYFYYLYQNCGGIELFWNLLESGQKLLGMDNIDKHLSELPKKYKKRKQCFNFDESAISFAIAKIHNTEQFYDFTNGRRFFLTSRTLPRKQHVISAKEKLTTKLKTLPMYSPIIITSNLVNYAEKTCPECKLFWVQKYFPFRIFESGPHKPEETDVTAIIIKSTYK